MKIIFTKNRDRILVDNEDYKKLNQFPYYVNCKGYASHMPYKKRQLNMHQQVMGGKREGFEIDHINRNKLDNRKCNLRFVTHAENILNRGIQKDNKSGYKGVAVNKGRGKPFIAKIRFKGIVYYLGMFNTAKEAALAYNKKAKDFSSLAYLNQI